MRTRAPALVLAVVLAGLGIAHAAQLPVTGGHLGVAQAGPCSAGVTVTRTDPAYFLFIFLVGYEGVRISGDLEGCRGREVRVVGTTGAPTVTAVVPSTGSTTVSVATERYATGRTFAVTVDGWQVPSSTVNP